MSSSGYRVTYNKIETVVCDFNFLEYGLGNKITFPSIPPHNYNSRSINDIDFLITTDDPVCFYSDKSAYSATIKIAQDPLRILNNINQTDNFTASFSQSQYKADIKIITI